MYNKPRGRLTLTRETNLHTTNSLASLQIVPTVSSSTTHNSAFSRHTQQFDKSTVQPQEQIIFRPTQIFPSDVNMKRFNHQGPPDFTLNQFAEKVPIHFRSNKKQIVPAAACAHDLTAPPDIVQDVEESGRSSRSSSHLSPNTQKAPAYLPGDRVIFAESPSAPGIPVVYRTPEERQSNPDRLNLDRRKLSVCPILEGEEQLRLLNYQHNMISKIQHLSALKRLIFLDLYDNQIDEISGLSSLKSLRVLMLGKNRIRKIENLDTLLKLDVLDLHGNQISNIEHLTHLSELRVLNLAGNMIVHVDNLTGMDSLAELNLRRNKIKTVVDVENLPSLQRLFLSFNDISSFEDIACLGESTSLTEISLDGNPIAQEQYYKQIVLRHMQNLKQLDMKKVTDVSLSRRSQPFNPLYQLMSMPGLRSGLARTGVSASQTSDTNSSPGLSIRQKPFIGPFASGELTSVESEEKMDRRRLPSGKPRFLMVRATDWAVNTTSNSKSQTIQQPLLQKEAILSNKTGMATTRPAFPLFRSYTSFEDFRKTKVASKKSAASFTDPLCPSPMFTLSPVEGRDDLNSEISQESCLTSTSKPGSVSSTEKDTEKVSSESNARSINDHGKTGGIIFNEELKFENGSQQGLDMSQNSPSIGGNEDVSEDGHSVSTSKEKVDLKIFDTDVTKALSEKLKRAGDKIESAIHENESILDELRLTKLENKTDSEALSSEVSSRSINKECSSNEHGDEINSDVKREKKSSEEKKSENSMASKKTAWDQSVETVLSQRPGSEHLESRRNVKVDQSNEKTNRPSSEHKEKNKKSLIESVLLGLNVFKKDSKSSKTDELQENMNYNSYSFVKQKETDLQEKDTSKMTPQRPVWRVIDKKIVKMACSEEDLKEIIKQPEGLSNTQSKLPVDESTVLPGMVSTSASNGSVSELTENIEMVPQKPSLATGKYDISITRNFYSKSSGVDQITMIIPRSPNDNTDTGQEKGVLDNGEKQSCDSMKPLTEEQKKVNDAVQPEDLKTDSQQVNISAFKQEKVDAPLVKSKASQEKSESKDKADSNLEMLQINTLKRESHIEKLDLKLEREKSETHKMLRTSHSLPNLWKSDKNKSPVNGAKPEKKFMKISQQKEQHEFCVKGRPDNLTIQRETPIQGKAVMQTIPESEQVSSPLSAGKKMNAEMTTKLPKSASAPALISPGGSIENYVEGQIASPTSPSTPIEAESTQPKRKNSGTTMGQSVVKQSYKNTPLMLSCSAVVPTTQREDEKRVAFVMARKEEEKKKDLNKTQIMKEKKRLAINNARRQWEVMQGNMINKSGKLSRTPDLYANHVGSIPNAEFISPDGAEESLEVESINSTRGIVGGTTMSKKVALMTSVYSVDNVFPKPCVGSPSEKQSSRGNSRPSSAHSSTVDPPERPRTANNTRKTDAPKGLKETIVYHGDNRSGSDLNHLADLEGDTVTFYGAQSLEALDRNWGMQAAAAVTHIIFKFIDFEDIAKHLYKVRTKFPGVQTITFSATNIRSYQQINALSSARRFDNLIVENEGNPITKFTLWRSYVVFRLAHFALKKINEMEVTAADIVNAEKLYGPVSHITTSQLPQSRLLSLVGEARRKQVLSLNDDKSKKLIEGKLDKSQNDFVGRAGLTHHNSESVSQKQQEQSARRNFARSYVNEITKEAIFTDRKRNELLKQWPMIFHEMVYSAVTDMSDMQSYMKKCLEDLEKS